MTVLSIDFETRSTVDLKRVGVYLYAVDPTTDVWCMAWALDDDEPRIWTPAAPLPEEIVAHIRAGGELRAWNAAFERLIWREIMVPRYGAPEVPLEQWVCTMAEAAAMGLPRALGKAAQALGIEQMKDDGGYRLMLQMTRPRKLLPDGTIIWWDDPAKLERLYRYCQQDVRTERAAAKCLHRLPPRERELYLLTERMNDRGIGIDVPLVTAAQGIVDRAMEESTRELIRLTGGAVTSPTKRADLVAWLREQGVEVDSVAKSALRDLLDSELEDEVRRVVELRVESAKSSTAKLSSMLTVVGADSRARGLMVYHGAATGRWTGALVQPHNFPRGEVTKPERFIPLVLAGDYESLDVLEHPLAVVSSMLRSMLRAAPGHRLIAADYSAIEARVLNWIAQQLDVVEMFARGVDVYKYNASVLYNIPIEDVRDFPHRQTGKFQELGCGYQMGWRKAMSAAKEVYGLNLDAPSAQAAVNGYRDTHPMVTRFWDEANAAALQAVAEPGVPVTFGPLRNLKFVKRKGYLYLALPAGRVLCYAQPKIVDRETPWGEVRPSVEFSGVDSLTKQWVRQHLYGGLITENIVQAISRDIMAHAKLQAERRGYLPILSVHDEIVAEVPEGFGSLKEFEAILAELPEWAAGCPIKAEGWEGERYRK